MIIISYGDVEILITENSCWYSCNLFIFIYYQLRSKVIRPLTRPSGLKKTEMHKFERKQQIMTAKKTKLSPRSSKIKINYIRLWT